MSCLATSATRRSRIDSAAVLQASAAASSHDVLLVPMTSITLYTLIPVLLHSVPTHPGDAAQHRCCQSSTQRRASPSRRASSSPQAQLAVALLCETRHHV